MSSLLLTSFRPWKAHQVVNSSDELLAQLVSQDMLPNGVALLRKIPVHSQIAPMAVMARVFELRPRVLVCCGMAEKRDRLSLEQQGVCGDRVVQTPFDLAALIAGTTMTEISTDAGRYVCNDLYHHLLTQFERDRWPIKTLFIHVPRITPNNALALSTDFHWVLRKLNQIAIAGA